MRILALILAAAIAGGAGDVCFAAGAPMTIVLGETDLPNVSLTPGETVPGITATKICSTKWGKDERHVSASMKEKVFAEYHFSGNDDAKCVPDANGKRCEIDHRIPRELGGADAVDNLWPQPYGLQPYGAHEKDRLENWAHRQVCAGKLKLPDAQAIFTGDWRAVYLKQFGHL